MENRYWSWERCSTKIRSLSGRLGFARSDRLTFLGLTVSLKDGSISDNLAGGRKLDRYQTERIYCILYGYASSEPVEETSTLISFRQIPGGWLYFRPFTHRVLKPLEKSFGSNPRLLVEAGKLLGGSEAGLGDSSIKIYALPLVPLIIVLYAESEEFPASANVFYDSSVTSLLSTEEIVMLSELTAARLRQAVTHVGKSSKNERESLGVS